MVIFLTLTLVLSKLACVNPVKTTADHALNKNYVLVVILGIIFGLMVRLESVEIFVPLVKLILQVLSQLLFALLAKLGMDWIMEFVKYVQVIVTSAQIIDVIFAKMDIILLILDHVLFALITVYSAQVLHHLALPVTQAST